MTYLAASLSYKCRKDTIPKAPGLSLQNSICNCRRHYAAHERFLPQQLDVDSSAHPDTPEGNGGRPTR